MIPKIVRQARGISLGVQTSYADALRGMAHSESPVGTRDGDQQRNVPPSIGYKCPTYAPGMGPAPMSDGDTSIDVGGTMRLGD